jgi:hypothetical protein
MQPAPKYQEAAIAFEMRRLLSLQKSNLEIEAIVGTGAFNAKMENRFSASQELLDRLPSHSCESRLSPSLTSADPRYIADTSEYRV